MGIFDRLGRVARAEVSEMKRVLGEARNERSAVPGDAYYDQAAYEADIAAADAELARDLGDPLSDVFARELGPGGGTAPRGNVALDPELARGASLWGRGGEPEVPAPASTSANPGGRAEPSIGPPVQPGWVDLPTAGPNPWAAPTSPGAPTVGSATPVAVGQPGATRPSEVPRPGRTETFPREVREAYAVLELPLGADRSRIEQAFKALSQRYHPDQHAGRPELQRTATELSFRLKEARDHLFAWLEGRA